MTSLDYGRAADLTERLQSRLVDSIGEDAGVTRRAVLVGRRGRVGTARNIVTFLVGVVVMYATDLFVAF